MTAGDSRTWPATLAFTPDGDALLYGTYSDTLKLWRGATAPVRDGP